MNLVAHQKRRICLSAPCLFNIHLQWTCHCPPKCFRSTHPSKSIFAFLWVKQCHKPSPSQTSHHHFYRRFVYHSQSWVVYCGLWHCFPTLPKSSSFKMARLNIAKAPRTPSEPAWHPLVPWTPERNSTPTWCGGPGWWKSSSEKWDQWQKKWTTHAYMDIYIYTHGSTIHIYICYICIVVWWLLFGINSSPASIKWQIQSELIQWSPHYIPSWTIEAIKPP